MPSGRKKPGARAIAEADLCLYVQRLSYSHTVQDEKQKQAMTRRGDVIKTFIHERDGTNARGDRWFYDSAAPEADRAMKGFWAEWRPTPENYVPRKNNHGADRNEFYAQTSPRYAFVFAFNVFNADNAKVQKLTEPSWDETAHGDLGVITAVGVDTITDSSKSWTTDMHVGKKLTVGRREPMIIGNTADTLTIERDWQNVPEIGDQYVIENREDDYIRHMDRRWRLEISELPAPMVTEINQNHYASASWTFLSPHIKSRRVQTDPGTSISDDDVASP